MELSTVTIITTTATTITDPTTPATSTKQKDYYGDYDKLSYDALREAVQEA